MGFYDQVWRGVEVRMVNIKKKEQAFFSWYKPKTADHAAKQKLEMSFRTVLFQVLMRFTGQVS